MRGNNSRFVRFVIVSIGRFGRAPRGEFERRITPGFMLKFGGLNNIGDIFVNVKYSSVFFIERTEEFFCFVQVTVSGNENANGSTVY